MNALSSTCEWNSSGPITRRSEHVPDSDHSTRSAQKRLVSNRISAPRSRRNARSPVASTYCITPRATSALMCTSSSRVQNRLAPSGVNSGHSSRPVSADSHG